MLTTTLQGIGINHLGYTPSFLQSSVPTHAFDHSTSHFSTTTSPLPQSVGSKPDVKHEHVHYHFQAGNKKFQDSHSHHNSNAKPVNPSYAIVNYLDVKDGHNGNTAYQPQTFQDRRGTYLNNNNEASSPSLVYSKVVKIEQTSTPYSHPDYLYRHNDGNLGHIGKSTDDGVEIKEEENNSTATTTNKSNFYFPVSPKRENGKVETKLVTPDTGGKYIFTDTFPFFKRVARIDDTGKPNQQVMNNEKNATETTEDGGGDIIKNLKHADKNSRRIL